MHTGELHKNLTRLSSKNTGMDSEVVKYIRLLCTYASGPGSVPSRDRHGIFWWKKPGSQHWGLCIPCESDKHINVGPVSILSASI